MNESQWLSSSDPAAMLNFLRGGSPLRAECPAPPSDRKLRLFAVACCRACTGDSPGPRVRAAVDTVERYADGLAMRDDLDRAWNASLEAPRSPGILAAGLAAIEGHLADRMPSILACLGDPASAACLLRDVFGNPFRPARLLYRQSCPPACQVASAPRLEARGGPLRVCGGCGYPWECPWLTPTVLRLARGVYADRDFAALPVLADALEESGCEEEVLLRHLRGWERNPECVANPDSLHEGDCWIPLRGPCVRGCHALDALLGKG